MSEGQDTSWTATVPDARIGILRLTCGHAKLWRRNIGTIMPGAVTYCPACRSEVGATHEITHERK